MLSLGYAGSSHRDELFTFANRLQVCQARLDSYAESMMAAAIVADAPSNTAVFASIDAASSQPLGDHSNPTYGCTMLVKTVMRCRA
jgi:hypothetical protein